MVNIQLNLCHAFVMLYNIINLLINKIINIIIVTFFVTLFPFIFLEKHFPSL